MIGLCYIMVTDPRYLCCQVRESCFDSTGWILNII